MGFKDVFKMFDSYFDSIVEKDIQKFREGALREGFTFVSHTYTVKGGKAVEKKTTKAACGCEKCDTHAVEDFLKGLEE